MTATSGSKRISASDVPLNYRERIKTIVLSSIDRVASKRSYRQAGPSDASKTWKGGERVTVGREPPDKKHAEAFADYVATEAWRLEIPSPTPELVDRFWGNIGFRLMYKKYFGHLPGQRGPKLVVKDKPAKATLRQRKWREKKRRQL
jgi:hypothetical protein